MTDELTLFRADVPPADPVAMARARAALVRATTNGNRTRLWWQVGITIAVAAAVVAAVFSLPSSTEKPPVADANGLTHNPDGSITIEFREVADVRAVNQVFYEEGIRAFMINSLTNGVVECWTEFPVTPSNPYNAPTDIIQPRPNPWGDVLTFWPNRIPDNMWLYIQAMVESPGNREVQLNCNPGQQVEISPNWIGDMYGKTYEDYLDEEWTPEKSAAPGAPPGMGIPEMPVPFVEPPTRPTR